MSKPSSKTNNKSMKFLSEDLYVYKTSLEILKSLEVMYFDSLTLAEMENTPPPMAPETTITATATAVPASPFSRETTPISTIDKEFYKSDFYKFNLRREVNGLPKLTEEEFDKLVEEQQETESISGSEEEEEEDSAEEYDEKIDYLETIYEKSIQQMKALSINNGNDNEEEDDQTVSHLATKSPYILFKSPLIASTQAFAIYKSLFSPTQLLQPLEAIQDPFQKSFAANGKSAIFMIGGGHFAAAIISHASISTNANAKLENSVNVLKQKSIHRYTTRRKQGGSQSASDNAHGKANSAGSALRRHNEAMLVSEVKELLVEWRDDLKDCVNIFIKANGASNRKIIVNSTSADSVIRSDDPRVKTIPFTTKRATMTELKRSWVELSYWKIVDRPQVDERKLKEREAKREALRQSTIQRESQINKKPELSQNDKHTKEIIAYLKKGRGPLLMAYLQKHKLSASEFRLSPSSEYHLTPTILHYASSQGLKNLIPTLVQKLKCDITVQNANGKTAYELAAKPIRQVFQFLRFELGEEDSFNWEQGKVGPPIDKQKLEAEEREQQQRLESEKKAAIKELLSQPTEEEIKKAEGLAKARKLGNGNGNGMMTAAPSLNQVNLNSLSDDQRMRLMREQRARAAEARMKAASLNR